MTFVAIGALRVKAYSHYGMRVKFTYMYECKIVNKL